MQYNTSRVKAGTLVVCTNKDWIARKYFDDKKVYKVVSVKNYDMGNGKILQEFSVDSNKGKLWFEGATLLINFKLRGATRRNVPNDEA